MEHLFSIIKAYPGAFADLMTVLAILVPYAWMNSKKMASLSYTIQSLEKAVKDLTGTLDKITTIKIKTD